MLCILKMFIRMQSIFWYNLEHHTTYINDFMPAESEFCRFSEIDTPKSSRANMNLLKKLFWNLHEGLFLACKSFSMHFQRMLCIPKMFIRTQRIFWYNLEHHTTHTNYFTPAESDFCRFWEIDSPKSSRANMNLQKKLFWNLDEALFLACKMFSMHFQRMLCIQKMFIRTQSIFWYNLEHHKTHRNYFTPAKSDFCRFYKIDTPKSSRANMNPQKKLFSNFDEALFLARKIFSMHFQRMLCIPKMFIRT